MNKRGISQEMLKLIACVTMLIDHVGATLVLKLVQAADGERAMTLLWIYYIMRMIGRIAFPIYCFLLVEGTHYTRDPKKYGMRLAVGALLSEVPFDLAFYSWPEWGHNNVMATLLLGFLMLRAMERSEGMGKLAWIVPFYFAAEWLHTDYGGTGILVIAILAMTRGVKHEKLLRLAAFLVLFCAEWPLWYIGSVGIPMQQCTVLSLIPIFCYSGRKLTHSKAVQRAFYLFYPAHMLVLYFLQR